MVILRVNGANGQTKTNRHWICENDDDGKGGLRKVWESGGLCGGKIDKKRTTC